MKPFVNLFSNRVIALYLIWIFINFVLLILSGRLSSTKSFDSDFFPFGKPSSHITEKEKRIMLIYEKLSYKYEMPDYETFKKSILEDPTKRQRAYDEFTDGFLLDGYNALIAKYGQQEILSLEDFKNSMLTDLSFRKEYYNLEVKPYRQSKQENVAYFDVFEAILLKNIIEDENTPAINSFPLYQLFEILDFRLSVYDYSEFIIYSSLPIFLLFIFRLRSKIYTFFFSNTMISLFLIWVIFHFTLFLSSGNLKNHYPFNVNFFPFDQRQLEFNIDVYDYSEFIIYTLTPLFIYFVLRLWGRDKTSSISKSIIDKPVITERPIYDMRLEESNSINILESDLGEIDFDKKQGTDIQLTSGENRLDITESNKIDSSTYTVETNIDKNKSGKEKEISILEKSKKSAFINWIIFVGINLFVAFWNYFFDPFSPISNDPSKNLASIIGILIFMLSLPCLIALIHRIITKRPSTPLMFGWYYIIFLFVLSYLIWIVYAGNIYYKLNLFDNFQEPKHQQLLLSAIIGFIIYGLVSYAAFKYLFPRTYTKINL